MKNRNFIDSLNAATEGFIYVMRTQRNMRIHFMLGVLVVVTGIYLDFSKEDFIFVCLAIALVLICEMFNTSMEVTVDMVKDEFHPMARIIKDVSAGAVFISSLNAIIVGYVVFSSNLKLNLGDGIYKIRQSDWHVTFIALLAVFASVVLGKTFSKKGTPFKGGMPSGHAAFAFAVWAVTALISHNGLVAVLTFVMAGMIARNRVLRGIHTPWEVIAGGLLGALLTVTVFQMLG